MDAGLPASTRTGWTSSLHWRIVVWFVVLIAVVIAAQGGLFLWLLEQAPGQPQLTETRPLGAELSRALEADPQFDLDAFVARLEPDRHVFVIMADGRVRGTRTPLPTTVRDVITDLNRTGSASATWENSVYRAVPVNVNGRTVGVLGMVPPTSLEAFGIVMAAFGLLLLFSGAIVAAFFIVRPVRRRIRQLEDAALRLGSGDLEARALAEGNDEVAELARSFNKMASDLARHAADLDASDRARRQLLADVSHELMTPLTAVLGHLETLMMAEVRLDDARRQKYLGIAAREAHRLERLIGDLLDTARLEAGGGELDPDDVNISELFDRVIAHHEYERVTRKIQIDATVGPGANLVFGDPFRIEQALVNVTANALRHSPDGGRIALAAEVSDAMVGITITDWGEGIAPEHLPLIFDRFYKARASRSPGQREGGSGLGLSIVRAIVTRHGGRVSATSVPGQGTTIRLDLPLGHRAPAAGFTRAERSDAGRSVA